MRSTLVCAAVLAMLSVSASAYAQQPDQPQQPPVNEDKVKEPKAAVDKAPPPPPVPSTQIGAQPAPAGSATPAENGEKAWRDRFAKLRAKLQQDEDALSIMQRELGVLDVQYYNDPNKALQQNLTRGDINAKTAKIDAGKQAVEADKQAISDAEDELRKSGGDIGWSR